MNCLIGADVDHIYANERINLSGTAILGKGPKVGRFAHIDEQRHADVWELKFNVKKKIAKTNPILVNVRDDAVDVARIHL